MTKIDELIKEFNEVSDIVKFVDLRKDGNLYLLVSNYYIVPFESKELLAEYLKNKIEIIRG